MLKLVIEYWVLLSRGKSVKAQGLPDLYCK